MKNKNFQSVEIGHIYERRDGQKAVVFNYDVIHDWYDCVILGTTSFFSVHEDGLYLESKESHNDLIFDYNITN